MRKPKRKELVSQIMTETGVTGEKKTSAYFSRGQLLDLLSIVRAYKLKIKSLTVGKHDNDGTASAYSN